MTRDEIRGLLGGYATGTLSEAERRRLFEAALEDQELFDELAGEQALKEALEDSGAKARLIAALQPDPAPNPWWVKGWVWGAAAAACVVVIAGIVLVRSSVKVEEVARLEAPPPVNAPENAPVSVPPVNAPAPVAAPENPPPVLHAPVQTAPKQTTAPLVAPEKKTDQPEQPAAPTPAQAKTEAALDRVEVAPAPLAAVPPPVPPGAAVPAPAVVQGFAANGTVAGTLTAPTPGVGGGGGGGRAAGARGGGGRGGAARALAQPEANALKAARFAFDYTVTAENVVRVTPHANGFLSVYVTGAAGMQAVVQGQAMQAEMPAEVQLPKDAGMAMVVFSAQQRAGFFGGAIAGSGDPLSGSKSDPNPSPNSMLVAQITLRR